MLKFEIDITSPHNKARLGRLTLSHGEVETPIFMPVGTQATVKTLTRKIFMKLALASYFPIPITCIYALGKNWWLRQVDCISS